MKALKLILLAIMLVAGMALDSEGIYGWVALAVALTSAILLLCIMLAGGAKSKEGGRP